MFLSVILDQLIRSIDLDHEASESYDLFSWDNLKRVSSQAFFFISISEPGDVILISGLFDSGAIGRLRYSI